MRILFKYLKLKKNLRKFVVTKYELIDPVCHRSTWDACGQSAGLIRAYIIEILFRDWLIRILVNGSDERFS